MLKRIVLGAVILGTLVGGIIVSYRAWEKKETPPPPPPPEAQMQGIDLDEWVDGRKVWSLKSDRVTFERARERALLRKNEARFWEGDRMVSSARSPLATLELRERKIQMEGGITIHSLVEDASVSADRIDWAGGQRRLHATGEVTFRRGENVVRCRELWADASLRRVTMNGTLARFFVEIQ